MLHYCRDIFMKDCPKKLLWSNTKMAWAVV
jgi:hypothetical protein